MFNFLKIAIWCTVGIILGFSISAKSTDTASLKKSTELNVLYEISIKANMIYLQCLKEDCKNEKLTRDAIITIVDNIIYERGYLSDHTKRADPPLGKEK